MAPGNPKGIRGVADLNRGDVVLINRELGAGSRHILDQAMATVGLRWGYGGIGRCPPGRSRGDCGRTGRWRVSAASVAETFGLGFLPLQSAHYDLVTLKPYLEDPPVQKLLATLSHHRVLSQLERLGGYDTPITGEVIATVTA